MTITTEIKKALRAEFPKNSFRVSTKRGQTTIEWDLLDLGSPATVKAVEAVAQQFLPFETFGNSSKQIYPLTIYPNISPERAKWAREWVLANYKDIEWDNFNSFRYSDKSTHHYGNVDYVNYYYNGVCSHLVDEKGQEPYEKYEYYRDRLETLV